MPRSLPLVLAVSLLLGPASPGQAPPGPILSKPAALVREKAGRLPPDAHISVLPFDAREAYGRFVSSDLESMTFYDIDQKTNVTLKFEAVRKIKDGYGGYNSVSQRHTDRRRALIFGLVVVAGLAALIGAAATSK